MDEWTYLNFDLRLERRGQGLYRARVVGAPLPGSAAADFLLSGLEPPLLSPSAAPAAPPDPADLRAFGRGLFQAVFGGEVLSYLRGSHDEARRQGATGLRLRLLLADVPELAALPWEYLLDPVQDDYFCLSNETPIVRYLDLPHPAPPLPLQPPLRVLALIAGPDDRPALDVDREWARVQDALAGLVEAGRVAVERLEPPTLGALQQALRRQAVHILHFVGHGDFDEEGLLVLEDEAGQSQPVGSRRLGALLGDERTLRLAVLNACEGGRASEQDPFSGVAQGLLRRGIPAVIAMQNAVSDPAARTFAAGFYAALADGYPVDAALTEARKAIFLDGNEWEWATPVFYVRLPDGRVFDLAPAPPVEEPVREEEQEPQQPPAPQAAYAARARPARGGDSIGHFRGGAATLGCLVVDRQVSESAPEPHPPVYLLCDASGISPAEVSPRVGDLVLQPGPADGGDPVRDALATLEHWTVVRDESFAAENLSAAIARVLRLEDVSPQIQGRGYLRGVRAAAPGATVFAVGRTSGLAQGVVLRVGAAWEGFRDLIETTPMLQAGDSGAILTDAENYALGLGFAGGPEYSLFLPIQRVLDAFQVELVTEEVWRTLTAPGREASGSEPRLGASAPGTGARAAVSDSAPGGEASGSEPRLGASAVGGADLARYERELRDLREQAERGRLVLFLGADLPQSVTGLPSRQALADALSEREKLAPGRSLTEVAQEVMGHGTRWGFTNFLRDALDTVGREPQPFHRAVVALVGRYRLETLVTTAYDDLLEVAFRQAGAPLDVVVGDAEAQFINPDRPALICLYGQWRQAPSLIVTAQDQNRLVRGQIKQPLVDELRIAFRRKSLLFLGHDPGDQAVGAFLDELVDPKMRPRSYAVWSGLSQGERDFFEAQRNLQILDVDPTTLVQALVE